MEPGKDETMSEITKLYSLAGVEKECKIHTIDWQSFKEYHYPPFTAEKQIELIKWLMAKAKDYQYDVENGKYWFIIDDYRETKYRDFDEALAELITLYWQDLTEEEQNEIRNILKG